ncbi:MAG: molybdopterin-dependent oxidoreductase [Pseudomonadota bacterium]
MDKAVYSLCFMCSVRCPIKVSVKNGQVTWVEGNPLVPGMEGSLCPKGAAGISMQYDAERLQHPMIRDGARGEGKWRKASWDEALDTVAEKLGAIIKDHGGRAVAFGERANLATHVSKTLMKAIGSPNHFSHDALCKGSVNTACRSLFGVTDAEMGMDYKNTKHIVLFGRNIFESVSVKEVNSLTDAMEKGAKMTYIDPRVTVTATKADRYWMIRPGTDLALIYAMTHVALKERLYDAVYVNRWVHGLAALEDFIKPYTPEWAEGETGVPAAEIVDFVREVAKAAPAVIFHFGYRGAHHAYEVYLRRGIMILNTLMGSVEHKGGFFFKKGPGVAGGKAARKLVDQKLPKPADIRFDKVGTPDFPLPDPAHGVAQILAPAILNEDPYPIKALIINRFDPMKSIPNTNQFKEALEKLDLVVAIDVNFSDLAWYADVVLPESTYFERTDCLQQANGLKPQMFLRRQAVSPRYDTREAAVIMKQIAERLGHGEFFPYETMDDLVRWQLEGTGFTLEDFDAKGFVAYCKDPIFCDRADGLPLKTPSGKIEFVSSLLESAGQPSFLPYTPVPAPTKGAFRLTVGRVVMHTHVSTQNNPYLNELFSENRLWMNAKPAASLGIKDGDLVEITSGVGSGRLKAYVSELIHPEAVFMVHGFGHEARLATRCFNRGVSDSVLQENITDMVGGSPALHDTFVTVNSL